jgi:hypothetical protein
MRRLQRKRVMSRVAPTEMRAPQTETPAAPLAPDAKTLGVPPPWPGWVAGGSTSEAIEEPIEAPVDDENDELERTGS